MLRMFDYECEKCGAICERIVRPGEVVICQCGERMTKLMPRVNVNMGPVPVTGYYDDNLETFIRTKAHRKEVMRQKGVTEHGDTPKEGQAWV